MKMLASSRIVIALVFALGIIASAALFKGTPAAPWIEAALVGTALSFVVLRRPECSR